MNIFVLDSEIETCVTYYNDKHVVKIILEVAQILSTNVNFLTGEKQPEMYRSSHLNHPITSWSRETLGNFIWTYTLGVNLAEEYTYRFGKIHKSSAIIENSMCYTKYLPQSLEITPFAQAMPEELRSDNAVESYREYYRQHKSHIAKWTKRDIPYWW